MTDQEKNAGNKLIAEFMGWTYFPQNDPRLTVGGKTYPAGWKRNPTVTNITRGHVSDPDYLGRNHSSLRYNHNWQLLMEACHRWDTSKDIPTGFWDRYVELSDLLDEKAALYEINGLWTRLVDNIEELNNFKREQPAAKSGKWLPVGYSDSWLNDLPGIDMDSGYDDCDHKIFVEKEKRKHMVINAIRMLVENDLILEELGLSKR